MRKFLFFQVLSVFLLLIYHVSLSYAAKGSFTEYYNQGLEFYKQGKYDQAGKAFEKAIEIKPSDVYALYGLGNTHYCKSKYDEAVKTYKKAININPEYAKVHYSLSLAYSKLGMTREAEEEKATFRKLSKGDKGAKKSQTQAKAPQTKAESKVYVGKAEGDKQTEEGSYKVPAKKREAVPRKKVYKEIQRMPVTGGKDKADHSQTVFKGYSKETSESKHKLKPRVYTPRSHKKYLPSINILDYIKDKWQDSRLNKIWICIIGYIVAIQMWLCAVAFVGIIVWRIRNKVE